MRKALAFVLTFSVLLSTFAGLSILGQNWNGQVATSYESGTGTESDPFMIANPSQLMLVVTSTDTEGKYYKLANDIHINDTTTGNWYQASGLNQWVAPMSIEDDADKAFKGHFNGDGFKVYGLYINQVANSATADMSRSAGLFPLVAAGATITAVGVENSYVSYTCGANADKGGNLTGAVGALVGTVISASAANPVKISQSYADADTYLEGGFIGGIIGLAKGDTAEKSIIIENCYNNATGVANSSEAPALPNNNFGQYNRMGIVGVDYDNIGSTIFMTGCYTSSGNASGTGVRADADKSNYCTQWNAGVGTQLASSAMMGEVAKENMSKLDFENVYKTTATYPELRVFDRAWAEEVLSYEVWDGTMEQPTKGTGVIGDPFIIENAEQFAWALHNQADIGGENWPAYKLVTDIYLNNLGAVNWETGAVRPGYKVNQWNPGDVYVQLDGNGHMVYGLYVETNTTTYAETGVAAALIRQNKSSSKSDQWVTIKDLGVDNVYINTPGPAAVFIGKAMGGGAQIKLTGCYVGENATLHGYFTSAFVGYGPAKMTIENSAALATRLNAHKYDEANRTRYSGFLGGGVWSSTVVIKNSYTTTYLHPNGGEANQTKTNCYTVNQHFSSDVTISTANMQGYDVLTNADKMVGLGSGFMATKTYPVPVKLYEAVTGIWNGQVATGFEMGSGTANDPYIIDTGSELALATNIYGGDDRYYNKHFKIVKDINLNYVDMINWADGTAKEGYTPLQWAALTASDGISGTFYGENHVIRGLYINTTEWKNAGLISQSYAGVKMYNLGIDDAYVKSGKQTAIFVGHSKNANGANFVFENCYIGENTTAIAGEGAGGFVNGTLKTASFKNCYNLGKATSTGGGNAGGIAPDVWGGGTMTFEKCYSVSGIALNASGTKTYDSCYSTTQAAGGLKQISIENMTGKDVLENPDKMDMLGSAYTATEAFPRLSCFPVTEEPDEEEKEEEDTGIWNGAYSKPAEGSGAEDDPYIITNGAELAWSMNNGQNVKNQFYKLAADIYLNDVQKIDWETGKPASGYTVKQWTPRYFSGTIDGDYHVIYGLYTDKNPSEYVQSEANGVGFVSENEWNFGATFKNLGFDNVYFNGPSSVGVIAGNVKTGTNGKITADRVFVGSNVTLKGHSVGGFIGYGAGALEITNSYSRVARMTDVAGRKAGIIGNVWGTAGKNISNTYATDRIYGNNIPAVFQNNFCQLENIDATVLAASEMKGLTVLSAGGKMEALGDAFQATVGYPIIRGFQNTLPDDGSAYWDGTTSRPAGEGIFTDPFKITDGSELAWAFKGNASGAYFKIMNDIYLNDVEAINWATGEVTKDGYKLRKWEGGTFNGTLDGNGKVIYGMYINDESTAGAWKHDGKALISNVTGTATIEKLGIDKAYVQNKNGAAAFVGSVNSGCSANFNECYVGEEVVLKGYLIGGFVSVSGNPANVNKCYNAMPLENYINFDKSQAESPKKGGILGDCWSGANAISNSWSVETIRTNNGTVTNCYSTAPDHHNAYTPITLENMKGLDVLSNANKMKGLDACDAFFATDSFPVLKVFLAEFSPDIPEGDIWSGRLATTFSGGKGTEAEPYLISNGAELALAISRGGLSGSYFKLTKDIYLNDVTAKDWNKKEGLNVWLSGTPNWNGHLDGAGYIVYGIYYADEGAPANAGLIPVFAAGSIKNLGVRYAYVRANDHAAAFVGKTASTGYKLIEQCFADDTCDIAFVGKVYGGAGGILGYAEVEKQPTVRLTIKNCYSKAILGAALAPADRANGIIGTAWWSSYSIENCYSYGYPAYNGGNKNTAPWLVYQDGEEVIVPITDVIKKVYTDSRAPYGTEVFTFVARDNMIDTLAKTYMSGLDFANVWEVVADTTPKLKIFTSITGEETDLSRDSEVYASGKGTKKNPYIIMNEAQLRYLIESTTTKNKFYKLGADIYLNDTTKTNWMVNNPSLWYESGNGGSYVFEGTFDGAGHTVYGLYLNNKPDVYEDVKNYTSKYTGLFPTITVDATIANVHVRNAYISGTGYTGAIVGFIRSGGSGYATIMGCSADESVILKAQTAGGIVGGGFRGLNLYYSYFTGKLEATAASLGRQGALVGDIWSADQMVAECYTLGYTNYRPGYTPQLSIFVYSDISQSGSTVMSKENMLGDKAKKNMDLTWGDVWYTAAGKTPQLKVIPLDFEHKFTDEGEKGRVWSGKLASKFASGSGTAEDPYIIETPEQLAKLVTDGANATLGKHYKLACDIRINDTSYVGWQNEARAWISGSPEFGGHLDGDGHVVSGLYYNGGALYAALFPRVTGGAFIEKLGIVNSHLVSNVEGSLTQTYVAAFAASYGTWVDESKGYNEPRFSQCFADHTVYLEGGFVGGIFGGTGRAVHLENCYFTGEITATDHHGALIANIWGSTYRASITNSFDSTLDRDIACSNNGKTNILCTNYYHDGSLNGVPGNTLGLLWMRGESAREFMTGLDYENVWKIVENGTPVLRCFKNAEKYSCRREPAKVMIEFVTGDGEKLEPIYGLPGWDKIPEELPVPELYGYEFGGWYFFDSCDIPFDLEVFPQYNMYLHAKWIQCGFDQNFEGDIDEEYDIGLGTQLFKPGVAGYNPRYLHGGLRSVHTLGDGENPGLFLLSYENMLTVGNQYDIYFWVATSTENASGTVQLLHANHGQVDSDIVGYETAFEFTGLQVGKWTQYKYTFTANAPFILVKTPADVELYFDDIQVVDLKTKGTLGDLEGFNPDVVGGEPKEEENNNDMTMLWIIIAIAGGVILLGAVATVVIVVANKNKKKKAAEKTE